MAASESRMLPDMDTGIAIIMASTSYSVAFSASTWWQAWQMFITTMTHIFDFQEVIGSCQHTSGDHGKWLFRPGFLESSGRIIAVEDVVVDEIMTEAVIVDEIVTEAMIVDEIVTETMTVDEIAVEITNGRKTPLPNDRTPARWNPAT
jgi:hypothetical protein